MPRALPWLSQVRSPLLPQEELKEALKLFSGFRTVREGGNPYDRKHMLGRLVEKVWMKGSQISSLALNPSCLRVVTGV